MNELINYKETVTMTSLEIAKLTGKEHKNVLRDIEEQLGRLGGGVLRFEHTHINPQNGQSYKMYRLPKTETLILVSGYSVELRAKIIYRLEELSTSSMPKLPQTYLEALKALVVAEEEKITFAIEIVRMKPKADYFDALVDRSLLTSFRDTAKELGVKEKPFIGFLMADKYIYRDKKGKLMPYAATNNGYFEVKECLSERTSWAGVQTFVTPKGRETFRLLTQGIN